jgi:histidine phosphotransfer protein HptB
MAHLGLLRLWPEALLHDLHATVAHGECPSMNEPQSASNPMPSAESLRVLETVLDASTLAQLRQLDPQGRNSLLDRVLSAYAQSLRRMLAQFGGPVPEAEQVRHIAHSLKSASASVGALQLSEQCAQMERAARAGQTEVWQPQINALCIEASRLLAGLEQAGFAATPRTGL